MPRERPKSRSIVVKPNRRRIVKLQENNYLATQPTKKYQKAIWSTDEKDLLINFTLVFK